MLHVQQRLAAVRNDPFVDRRSYADERVWMDEERAATAIFVAAELAALQTPPGLRYDGVHLLGGEWLHHFTELADGPALHGSFAVRGLQITAAQIAHQRQAHAARFFRPTTTRDAGAEALPAQPPRQPEAAS